MPDLETSLQGQRLTLRIIVRDWAARFFSLENGWLRTARELFTEPGQMIRRYIEGERMLYANPFAYLLVATAISALVQTAVGFQASMTESTLNNPALSPTQVAIIQDLQRLLLKNMLYMSLGILIPFAIMLRLFFRRSGFNLAETAVFSMYTVGHTALFGVVLLPLSLLFSLHPAILGVPVTLTYFCYAAIRFFGGRVLTVLKTCVSYILGMTCYMIVLVLAVLAYIFLFQLPSFSGGDDWNMVTATEQGAAVVVKSLIEQGDDVNMTLRLTPLHLAAEQGNLEIVDLLLGGGAAVNARDHFGRVPLFRAIKRDRREVVWRLVEAGADPLARADDGTTLLFLAARNEDLDLVRWLLDNGADVNAVLPEERRFTALMNAVAKSSKAMVELLLEHGADPSIANDKGETALDLADSDAIADLLRAAAKS
jgi:ankyrin repeat protein